MPAAPTRSPTQDTSGTAASSPAGPSGPTSPSSGSPPSPSGSPHTHSPEPTPTDPLSPSPTIKPLSSIRLETSLVAELEQPLAMAVRKADPALYVAEKVGRVRAVVRGRVRTEPVLDLTDEVSLGGEQGLLGLAFSPEGEYLYVNFTDVEGDTRVVEFEMAGLRADEGSRRDVLFVDQPYPNHNGGNLAFGPDGYLYIGLGDGGSGGDPQGYAQSPDALLGKMLRIDPRPEGGEPYGVPEDNPFVDDADALPEIWAFGLRNPWRYSFDRLTGELWIGDVGQDSWEEINFQPARSNGGENYGWDLREGRHRHEGSRPPGNVDPVHEYPLAEGTCVVTGGYVYRGDEIPSLSGTYLFGDFCTGMIMGLRMGEDGVRVHALGPVVPSLSSFGQDEGGELYALSLSGEVFRLIEGSG